MSQWLTRVAAKVKKLGQAHSAPRPRRARLGVEALEERLVMAGNLGWGDPPPAPPNPWSYTVPSGHGSDTIVVSAVNNQLQVLDNNVPVPGTPLSLTGITSISITGGTNTVNTFDILSTYGGVPMSINLATASDSALVCSSAIGGGNVQGIWGPLTINGYNGAGKVAVDDSGDTSPGTFTIGNGSVSALGQATVSYQGVSSVVVKAGPSAGNSITMSTPPTGYNTFTAAPGKSTLSGTGYSLEADNFAHVDAVSRAGGGAASLYGAWSGTNTYYGQLNYSALTGPGYSVEADSFSTVNAFSRSSSDLAYLWGAAGVSNTFSGQPGESMIHSSNWSFYVDTHGFGSVTAYAGSASDTASLFSGYSGSTTFVGLANSSFLCGGGWAIQVNNFSHVGVSGNGSSFAELVSIAPWDGSSYSGTQVSGTLSGPGWSIQANGFGGSGLSGTGVVHVPYTYLYDAASHLQSFFSGLKNYQYGFSGTFSVTLQDPYYGSDTISW